MKQNKTDNKENKKIARQKKKLLKYPEKNEMPAGKKSRHTIRAQRNRNILVTAIMVAVLFAILIFISLKVLFIVQKVEITGTERYTYEEISAFVQVPYEESIFKIDVDSYETDLYNEFVYIDSVRAERKLPNKILITITDSVPTYYSETGESYTIYSQSFKKLTSQAQKPETLMGISADLSDEEITETLNTVIKAVNDKEYENVTLISVGSVSDIQVVYDNRITIKLGTVLQLDYKLKMAFHIIENEISEGESGTIDITEAGKAIYNINA